jgi:FlaG/FlaF family flagellin (archaellin)
MKRKFRRNLKGISTIIATIIIVAIAIVMAIAVAYWALGIGGSFTRFEKLQFTSAYVTVRSDNKYYVINMALKNTGTASATLDNATMFLNGQPLSSYATTAYTHSGATPSFSKYSLAPGVTSNGNITLDTRTDTNWVSGMTVQVTIQTAAGNQYPQVVVLP